MEERKIATIRGLHLPISLKTSIEICNFLRYKPTTKAKQILERVIEKKQAIPYKRFVTEMPHRRGKMATGAFPVNASKEILKLIKSVEANAQHVGLSSDLILAEMRASKGPLQWHYGRKRRQKMKRTHIVISVKEGEQKQPTKK